MRWLMLNIGKGFGGLEMQMVQKALDAEQQGDQAVVVVERDSFADEYTRKHALQPEYLQPSLPYIDPKAIIQLGGMLKRRNVDIIVCGQTKHLSLCLLARALYHPRAAVVLFQQMQSGLNKKDWFHNRVYGSLDLAIVLTPQMRVDLLRTTAIHESKVRVIPIGVDTARWDNLPDKQRLRAEFGLPATDPLIGFVARFDPQKGFVTAVEALAKSSSDTARLLLVGADAPGPDPYSRQVMAKAEELGVARRVLRMPPTDRIPELMSCMDIFVNPSYSETYGLVTLEAMAASLPVVGSDSAGTGFLVIHNHTGLLFPPADSSAAATALDALLGDETLRETMGKQGRRRVEESFSAATQSSLFLQACKESCARRLGSTKR